MATESRDEILRLAVESIDEGGEAAVRVNHIAAKAGVTPPVLYHWFGSRDGLVIAAQTERVVRNMRSDVDFYGRLATMATSPEALRSVTIDYVKMVLSTRQRARWERLDAIGSSYARPQLAAALAKAQGDLIDALYEVLEPFQRRGWFRPGLDLRAAISWQHAAMLSRAFVELGQIDTNLAEFDRIVLDSFVAEFFGRADGPAGATTT